MEKNIGPIRAAVETPKKDIEELESNFENWDSQSTAEGKRLNSIAERIILSGRRVKNLVKNNTYSP